MKNKDDLNFAKRFGAYICAGRIAKNLTQSEAAEGVGICQAYYSYIEAGKRSIDLKLAMKICAFLGLNLGEFIHNYTE